MVLFGVSLSYPAARIEVAKILEGTSKVLYKSVDNDQFDFDYWFDKLIKD